MPPGDLRLSPISRWHAVCEIRDSVGNETTEKLKQMETKIMNRKSNRFSPQGKEHTMTQKSKATRTEIRDLPEIAVELAEEEMRITAGGALASGTSSYLIDAPDGGSLVVRGNNLEKGPRSENPKVAIAIGEESTTQPTAEIIVESNTLKNDGKYETSLIWNSTATPAILKGNTLIGQIVPIKADGGVR